MQVMVTEDDLELTRVLLGCRSWSDSEGLEFVNLHSADIPALAATPQC